MVTETSCKWCLPNLDHYHGWWQEGAPSASHSSTVKAVLPATPKSVGTEAEEGALNRKQVATEELYRAPKTILTRKIRGHSFCKLSTAPKGGIYWRNQVKTSHGRNNFQNSDWKIHTGSNDSDTSLLTLKMCKENFVLPKFYYHINDMVYNNQNQHIN